MDDFTAYRMCWSKVYFRTASAAGRYLHRLPRRFQHLRAYRCNVCNEYHLTKVKEAA